MKTTAKLFINGRWQAGQAHPFTSLDPASGESVWEGPSASNADIDSAINAAREAQKPWAALDLSHRQRYLEAFAQALGEEKEQLAELISREVGKPLWETRGEIGAMIGKIPISIEAFAQRCPENKKATAHGTAFIRHHPHGVVAVFGPFNFPGHLPNGHIIPALLAGNTIVFKPSELTPAVGEALIQIWEHVQLPAGVLNLVQGARETGQYLASHQGIDAIFFTGSAKTGLILSKQFGAHPEKILALELGGNNPLIIGDIDNEQAVAYTTIQSAFISSGQRCTCARRLICIEGPHTDSFLEKLCAMTQGIHIGAYTEEPEPFLGPVISAEAAERLMEAQKRLIDSGARVLIPMKRKGNALLSPGILDVSKSQERPDEEIFGPLLQVIRVPDLDAAIREANNTRYGLSAGLLSSSEKQYQHFARDIRAGIVNWNIATTGASSAAPFGGVGISGNHRPSAYYAADYCSYPVASMIQDSVKLPDQPSPGIEL